MGATTLERVHVAEHTGRRQFRWYNVIVVFLMSFASIGMGYSASIISTTLAQPSFSEYFELETRPNGLSLIAATNGLFQAGAFFGSCCINFVADRWGRKMAITVPAFLVLISGACLGGAANIAMFLVFRFVSGMGSFWLLGSIPVWMTEVVPPKDRGVLVDIHSAALLFGYALAGWVGYGFYFYHPASNNQWRAPLAFQCLPVFIVLCAMYWLPESPRWLIQKDRHEEARAILNKLHEPEEAKVEMIQIQNQITIDQTLPHSWLSMVTKPSYRRRTFYAIGIAVGTQVSGVLVINNYGPTIYASLGLATEQQILYQAAYVTLSWGTGCMALLIVDRMQRQRLIALGLGLCMVCLTVEAALVASFPTGPTQNTAGLKAAVAMIFLYTVCAELLLDGTQYIYFAELFPNHLRAKGMTVAMASISLTDVMFLQVAPTAFANIGWKFYLCFIIPGFIFTACVLLFYPNTKGVPLEEIAALFGDDNELYLGPLVADGKMSDPNDFGEEKEESNIETRESV